MPTLIAHFSVSRVSPRCVYETYYEKFAPLAVYTDLAICHIAIGHCFSPPCRAVVGSETLAFSL